MIDVRNPLLYSDALATLSNYRRSMGNKLKGRFIQIFLALKYFQNDLPSMYSGSYVRMEILETMLDDLFAKLSKPATASVLSIFEENHLPRTGLIAVGKRYPQNTWRNNFNIQKGIVCYAPPAVLSSQTFLDQSRADCRFLNPATIGVLKDAECSLCPGGLYRREDHRKWLRKDPGGSGYALLDLENIGNFQPYLAPNGNRIPLLPLLVALYHDADPGLAIGSRLEVRKADFMADFNFSSLEIESYFDDSITNQFNAQLKRSDGWRRHFSLGGSLGATTDSPPSPRSQTPSIVEPPTLSGTIVNPPSVNSGWDAEQYVASALSQAGWNVYDVSRQQLGYDLFAQKGRLKRYIEVKSSLAYCSPTLTSREWQQAITHGPSYVLAIIENLNTANQNTIYWITDPGHRCVATPRRTTIYSIPRSSWTHAAVLIDKLSL